MSSHEFEVAVMTKLATIEAHTQANRDKMDEFVEHQYEINGTVTEELKGHQGKIGRLNGEVKILIGVIGSGIGIGGIVALAKKLLG